MSFIFKPFRFRDNGNKIHLHTNIFLYANVGPDSSTFNYIENYLILHVLPFNSMELSMGKDITHFKYDRIQPVINKISTTDTKRKLLSHALEEFQKTV